MEYFAIDRKKVRQILSAATNPLQRTEKYLCEQQGVSYPTYWRRFTTGRWKREQAMSLGVILGEIAGRVPFSIGELVEAGGTQ